MDECRWATTRSERREDKRRVNKSRWKKYRDMVECETEINIVG